MLMFLLGVYKSLKVLKTNKQTNKLLMMIIKYVSGHSDTCENQSQTTHWISITNKILKAHEKLFQTTLTSYF